MAGLKLDNLHKSYGNVEVIKGVDLEIKDGEFVVLVGPSGCGKSTLLRCIAGLEDITSGSLSIGGRVVNDVAPKDRDIAMVFQSYALYPHMTVEQNLSFALRLRKTAKAEITVRVNEAAELLGLGDFLSRYPKQLSGGQRQRVAMGRALVRRPQVFLFDEPLSNLDAALRVQMRAELGRLHQRLGTTMIYVTHDQVEAMTLADRIVILDSGKLQQVGPPLEVYGEPQNRFVGGFIGSPAMNFAPATIDSSGCTVLGHTIALPASVSTGPVLAGVRPEHLSLRDTSGSAITGVVDVLEPMGFEALVHLTCGPQDSTQTMVVRTESSQIRSLKVGQSVGLSFESQHLHLFDAESGTRLAL